MGKKIADYIRVAPRGPSFDAFGAARVVIAGGRRPPFR